jgi:hypothetical protein
MDGPAVPGVVVKARAPLSNTEWGGSRFVGAVQIRANGSRVWLMGWRVPLWWMVVCRVTRAPWSLRLGSRSGPAGLISRPILPWQEREQSTEPMETAVMRLKTVSWPAAESSGLERVVLRSSVNADMDVGSRLYRGGPGRTLGPSLTELRDGESEVRATVPLGLRRRSVCLCLEVANSQCERLISTLSGKGS